MDKLLELPKSRKEAIDLGELYYFTGIPCKRGHIDKRRTHNWECYSCIKIKRKDSDYTFKHKKHSKTMRRLFTQTRCRLGQIRML